uniref:Catechol O-methyltransferase n=1 Tax=Alexandrium andersonii TaxID=327968 RepID=A0A7S2F921_9DINO
MGAPRRPARGLLSLAGALLLPCVAGKLEGDGFSPATDGDWRGVKMHDILETTMGINEEGDVDALITGFDEYSERKRLGMNLGREKGDVIESTVAAAMKNLGNDSKPFAVLEVGAHFGDGTLRVVRAMLKQGGSRQGIIISFEANKGWASGCRTLVAYALAGHGVRVRHQSMVVKPQATVAAAAAVLEHFGLKHFSVVMLDHDHKRYLPDLKGLVSAGAIRAGGVVHADNAGRDAHTLRKYLAYVGGEGPFETRYEEISNPYPDRVAISQHKPREDL